MGRYICKMDEEIACELEEIERWENSRIAQFRLKRTRRFLSELRYKEAKKWLIGRSIDIGAEYNHKYFDVQCDIRGDNGFKKEDVQDLTFKDNSFDTSCCMEVLEHVIDPVSGIRELIRITKKRLIICVPNEPWFSLARLSWNKLHLWAITPKLIEYMIGRKAVVNKVFWIRWRFMVFDL